MLWDGPARWARAAGAVTGVRIGARAAALSRGGAHTLRLASDGLWAYPEMAGRRPHTPTRLWQLLGSSAQESTCQMTRCVVHTPPVLGCQARCRAGETGGRASWGCLSFPPAPPPRLLLGQCVVVWRWTWFSSLSASGSSVSRLSSGVLISPKGWQNQLPESGLALSVVFAAVTECDALARCHLLAGGGPAPVASSP